MFTPNLDLYVPFEDSERMGKSPYIAVFRKGGKHLIYIAENHIANESFDMTDFCLSDKDLPMPDVAVIEFENENRPVTTGLIQRNSLIYTGAVAAKKGIPVVFADLSQDEMLDVLRKQHNDQTLTTEDLIKTLRAGGPSTKKGLYNLMSYNLNKYGRDAYMVKNIAAALNKYNVVLVTMGEGHYRTHRLIIEDMMGTPEYINRVPNSRGDFSTTEIKPIKLI